MPDATTAPRLYPGDGIHPLALSPSPGHCVEDRAGRKGHEGPQPQHERHCCAGDHLRRCGVAGSVGGATNRTFIAIAVLLCIVGAAVLLIGLADLR